MNKKELQQRGKGLLALMLALIMMFGTSMTVLAETTYDLDSTTLKIGDTLQGGDTICATVYSGYLNIVIDGKTQNAQDYELYKKCYILPDVSDYMVDDYLKGDEGGDPVYDIALISIPIAPSGGSTGGGSTGGGNAGSTGGGNAGSTGGSNAGSTGGGNAGSTGGGSTASPEALEAPQTETGNGSGQPHVHSYSWVTTREATETQDGLDEYKCACGVVEAQVTIPASQAVVNGFYQTIREAAPNGRITCDTKEFYTLSDKMVASLAERSDVTVEITFIYQKTPYRMTIPAGSDYSALLADEDMFYGYFYFANQIGAQIEPVS